jgi:hypothetical protein
MIQAASKYARVTTATRAMEAPDGGVPASDTGPRRQPPRAFQVLVPRAGAFVSMGEWFWKELREGGALHRYLQRERARFQGQVRSIGRRMQHWRQNPKSDWELEFAVPARLYHRWLKEDPNFWRDRSNLRSLKRDNPELTIKV